MADTQTLEREYTIPLRREWMKVSNYRRAGRAVKAIKKFIARHMKVPNHDVTKVKLDPYLNNEIWFRGKKKPPAKIKIKAKKENDLVKVELVELPEQLRYKKQKHEKRHTQSPKQEQKPEQKPQEQADKKKEEEKKEEKEKEQSVAHVRAAEAKQDAKAQKHLTKVKEPEIQRMALKK